MVALCILLDLVALEEAAIRHQKQDITGANDILQNFKIALTSVTNTAVSINDTILYRTHPSMWDLMFHIFHISLQVDTLLRGLVKHG